MKKTSLARRGLLVFTFLGLAAAPAAAQQRQPREGRDAGQFTEKQVQRLDRQLDLTDSQEEEIKGILDARVEEMKSEAAAQRETLRADREARRAYMQSQWEETDRAIAAVLTQEQQEKYQTRMAERRGQMGQRRSEPGDRLQSLVSGLNLTDDQKEQLQGVFTERRTATRAWLQDHADASREEKRTYLRERAVEANAAVEAVLTPEQVEKYRAHRNQFQQERKGDRMERRQKRGPRHQQG